MTLNRMNTLMVSRELPDPNGVGVERRAAQHLGMLAALGPVTLVLPKWIGLSRSDRIAGLTALGASKVIIREEDPRPESLRLQHHATTSKPLRIWRALNRPPAFDDRVDDSIFDRANPSGITRGLEIDKPLIARDSSSRASAWEGWRRAS